MEIKWKMGLKVILLLILVMMLTTFSYAAFFPVRQHPSGNMFTDHSWWINTTEPYLYDSSGYLRFNESACNGSNITNNYYTTNYYANASGDYVYNLSNTIYFNETELNNTIDDRAGGVTTETDPLWTANQSSYYNMTEVNNLNGTWNADYLDGQHGSYYLDDTTLTKQEVKDYSNIILVLTGNTYNGAINGYNGANSICDGNLSGSHICSQHEVNLFNAQNGSVTSGDAWIMAGGPKYVPADIPVADCDGFKDGNSTSVGNYWHFDSKGGEGRALNCGTELKLACCK